MDDNIIICDNKSKPKKGIPVWVLISAIFLTIVLSVSTVLGLLYFGKAGKIILKLKEVDYLVNKEFTGEIDYEKLDETVLSGYINGLNDKFSFYVNKENAESVDNSFKGNAVGIGITFFYNKDEECFQVFRVNIGSPAESAGIAVGDKIVSVDGKTIKELGYDNAVAAFKKEIGETSVCEILRNGKKMNLTITHKEFVEQSVYYHITDNNFGYMLFTDFNKATVNQFENGIKDLTDNNVKGLIFDLRGNGGGTVDSVCKILDTLVGKCDLITVKYGNGEKKVLHKSDASEINLPMCVLVDDGTASAAELFAATIRDVKNGKLIGKTTYGKGIMQRTFHLSDGSYVRFTVADFYPAGGESFNKIGLEPDFEVEFTEEETKNKYVLGDKDPFIQKVMEVLGNE